MFLIPFLSCLISVSFFLIILQNLKFIFCYLFIYRLEVTYANNNNLIKKFENMPNMVPEVEEKPTVIKKKVNGIRKVLSEKSKGIINAGGGKQKVHTDSYF